MEKDEEAEEEEDAALRAERKELVRLMLQSPEMLDDDFGCNLADASDDADRDGRLCQAASSQAVEVVIGVGLSWERGAGVGSVGGAVLRRR